MLNQWKWWKQSIVNIRPHILGFIKLHALEFPSGNTIIQIIKNKEEEALGPLDQYLPIFGRCTH